MKALLLTTLLAATAAWTHPPIVYDLPLPVPSFGTEGIGPPQARGDTLLWEVQFGNVASLREQVSDEVIDRAPMRAPRPAFKIAGAHPDPTKRHYHFTQDAWKGRYRTCAEQAPRYRVDVEHELRLYDSEGNLYIRETYDELKRLLNFRRDMFTKETWDDVTGGGIYKPGGGWWLKEGADGWRYGVGHGLPTPQAFRAEVRFRYRHHAPDAVSQCAGIHHDEHHADTYQGYAWHGVGEDLDVAAGTCDNARTGGVYSGDCGAWTDWLPLEGGQGHPAAKPTATLELDSWGRIKALMLDP